MRERFEGGFAMIHKLYRGFWGAVVVAGMACSAFGQSGAIGTILGTVTDSSGAVVPNATVTITNTGTGVPHWATTSSSGDYSVPMCCRGAEPDAAQGVATESAIAACGFAAGDGAQREMGISRPLPGLEKGFHQTEDKELRRMCGLRLERAYTSLAQRYKGSPGGARSAAGVPGRSGGAVLLKQGLRELRVSDAAQKLFEVAPQSVWGLMAAGEAYTSQGDTDAAVRNYEAVEVTPQRLDPAEGPE
jgi:hypothetical protein